MLHKLRLNIPSVQIKVSISAYNYSLQCYSVFMLHLSIVHLGMLNRYEAFRAKRNMEVAKMKYLFQPKFDFVSAKLL